MKNFTVPLLLTLLFSFSVFSQSEEDYSNTLDFITKAYNENNAPLIHEKFSTNFKKELQEEAFKKTLDSLHADKGEMSSYEFLLEEEGERSFLVEFESGSMLMLLHLEPEGQISMFKITEY